jgi:hypothetical protein
MKIEDFAQAMKTAAKDMSVTIDMAARKAPVGFWEKVAVIAAMKDKEAARRYWRQKNAELLVALDLSPKSVQFLDSPNMPPDETNNTVTRNELTRIIDAMRNELEELIDSKIQTNKRALSVVSEQPERERPPKEKIGKQYAGKKADIRGLIDLALYELLEADAAENHNGNMSSCIDKALWHFYGKPDLSFQWPEEELEKRYAKYLKSKKKRRR